MRTFASGLGSGLLVAATSLIASRAHADPDPEAGRPYAQWHVDFYLQTFAGADLSSTPVHTSVGTLKGRDIGVSGVQTTGPLFPHTGIGVEIPHALFYAHAGINYLGRGTGQASASDSALLAFGQTTAAARLALGPFVVSLGPSVGFRYVAGYQAGGWDTGAQPTLGGELDARLRFVVPPSRRSYKEYKAGDRAPRRPTKTSDCISVHLTAIGIGGVSWMVALGTGLGSLPGQ